MFDTPLLKGTTAMILHCAVCAGLFPMPVSADELSRHEEVVPIEQEPNHRLVLNRDALRVFDVSFVPGATSLWHRHDKDSVLLCIDGANMPAEEPGKPLQLRPPIQSGQIYYRGYAREPYVHRIRNADKTVFRILDIEVLSPPRPAGAPLAALDSPWQVIIDNDRVRVSRIALAPRKGAAPVRFTGPRLFVAMTDGLYAIEGNAQPERRLVVRRGDLFAMDTAGTETLRNLAETGLELVVVEVK
ncbi:hypothetical protein [Caldimonas brevitalea]|uniref:Quercetin 2,3-dioxygenase C-terminal cupin domain-containing protein n=1 Tax=Caldimonas brevitalea TaxID=413882 RepID=A0A0G3BRW6_9BURK|nr:hypothetical protein [Caldimonas brevitalea]AKJ30131.1 hypothetical protein AAW51_3440 [Caldimonas brevitalea]